MLNGIDVSNHQNAMNFAPNDFVIIKASEGDGFLDPKLEMHYANLKGKLCGFYHYARPDLGNTPEAEADWFLKCLGSKIGKGLMALDWEGNSLAYSPDWAHRWLKRVYEKTGIRPLIYLQSSEIMKGIYESIANDNYGLWVAHWGVNAPLFKNWKFWALWQYQGSPLDSNKFNGTAENFKKYYEKVNNSPVSKPSPAPTPVPTPSTGIKVGDSVRVLSRVDYNNIRNDGWVLNATFTVMEKNGGRVVIGRNGNLTGVWRESDLKKV